MAQAYNATYRFEDAVNTFEEYIAELTKRRRPTAEAEKLLEKSKANLRMLKGVEEVCFIDSFVVDKKDFLKAYKISPESGKLFMYDTYFKNSNGKGVALCTKQNWEIKSIIASCRKTAHSTSYHATR